MKWKRRSVHSGTVKYCEEDIFTPQIALLFYFGTFAQGFSAFLQIDPSANYLCWDHFMVRPQEEKMRPGHFCYKAIQPLWQVHTASLVEYKNGIDGKYIRFVIHHFPSVSEQKQTTSNNKQTSLKLLKLLLYVRLYCPWKEANDNPFIRQVLHVKMLISAVIAQCAVLLHTTMWQVLQALRTAALVLQPQERPSQLLSLRRVCWFQHYNNSSLRPYASGFFTYGTPSRRLMRQLSRKAKGKSPSVCQTVSGKPAQVAAAARPEWTKAHVRCHESLRQTDGRQRGGGSKHRHISSWCRGALLCCLLVVITLVLQ